MKPDTDLNEVIRNEVKAAIKDIIVETIKEEIKTIKTGDYLSPVIRPKPDNGGVRDGETYPLPVVVKKPDGTIQHRRRKRTQEEMREVISKAIPIVKAKHPKWSERRVGRLAKNLVRRYKVIA